MEILAPAKVNLFLKVLNKRKDGFHNIFSIIQTISLFDRIKIFLSKSNKKNIIISCNVKKLNNKNNLCYKVADELLKLSKFNGEVRIDIRKNIPLGSGLGGASSDGASVALALIKLLKIKISKKKLIKILADIGKDIPYFLYKGCCIVEGAGEKIKRIENPPWKKRPLWFIIIYPNIVLSTKKVYETYDKITEKSNKFNKKTVVKLLSKGEVDKILINDLEKSAFKISRKLKKLKEFLNKNTQNVCMSGSGSCFFAVFNNRRDAICFKKKVEKQLKNCKIYISKSIN